MGAKQAHPTSDEAILRELQAHFDIVVALGLINSENAEAKLAEMSPRQRTELKAHLKERVERIAGIPIGTAQPEPDME